MEDRRVRPTALGEIGSLRGRAAAACVHAFTASGVLCALAALHAVLDKAWEQVFAWLGLAFLIDGIDGTFARIVDVKHRLPRFSGERLDVVVDYVTYVLVPALAMQQAGLLGERTGFWLAGVILMTSLYHFSDNASKTPDNCFVGFPAIWNIVAFYLFAFRLPQVVCVAVVLACAVLTFVPMRWLHPVRVERLLTFNIVVSVLWSLAALYTVWAGFPVGVPAGVVLAGVGLYGLALTAMWPWADTSVAADSDPN